jgi:hypothetical protein
MKKAAFLTALFAIISFGVKSQNSNQVSARLSFNQLELGYQRTFFQQKIWGETYVGLGNEDINKKFDDFVTGLRIGTPIFKTEKNAIHLVAGIGLYFSNNDIYSVVTPVYSGFIAYNRFLGKSEKQSLLINLGYQYGNNNYKQEYNSSSIYTATTGSFTVSPIYFSVGYGFHF